MAQIFDKDNPPKSGYAKKIWDWWFNKSGKYPVDIVVNRPGACQRELGTPSYDVNDIYEINKGDIEEASSMEKLVRS